MHTLNLEIGRDTSCRFITIRDASCYSDNNAVTNTILEINPPNKSCSFIFNLPTGWCFKTLGCEDFELCCIGDCKTVLPDGIYEIKYSVNPNLTTMVEFSHLRVCQLMTNYIKTIGLFLSNKHTMSISDRNFIEKELIAIKYTIDNAVYAVEDCNDSIAGLELYEEAVNRLNSINNGKFRECCK